MIDTAKSRMRKELKHRLGVLGSGVFYDEGVRGASWIQRQPLWKQYETVLLFLSMPSEIDTGPLLETALSEGKRVFAPRMVSDTSDTDTISLSRRSLCFFRVYSKDGPWHYGAYHIREPLTTRVEDRLRPEHFPALIIVPGMAFDHEGRRLGHGRAYYDRFFAGLDDRGLVYATIGFCLEAQLVERVPTDLHDKPMDVVYAGEGFYTQQQKTERPL